MFTYSSISNQCHLVQLTSTTFKYLTDFLWIMIWIAFFLTYTLWDSDFLFIWVWMTWLRKGWRHFIFRLNFSFSYASIPWESKKLQDKQAKVKTIIDVAVGTSQLWPSWSLNRTPGIQWDAWHEAHERDHLQELLLFTEVSAIPRVRK